MVTQEIRIGSESTGESCACVATYPQLQSFHFAPGALLTILTILALITEHKGYLKLLFMYLTKIGFENISW